MRKLFITVILLCFFCTGIVIAKTNKDAMPTVRYNGVNFSLYYSSKSDELNSYINEYYKQNESYTNWTELIALHHYPNAYYPIEHAKEFKSYIESSGVASNIDTDEENNSAILDFIVIDNRKLPIIMEYNVFKYVKSPVCGTIGLQYAKRQRIYNALETKKFKESFVKNRKKYIKQINKVKIPELITQGVEYGKYQDKEDDSDKPAMNN